MVDKKKMSKEEFLKKHPPLKEKEIKKRFIEADKAKDKYTKDVQELNKNLLGFKDILDPIIDPNTKKPLAWMRRPTNEQVETYFLWYDEAKNPKNKKNRLEGAKRTSVWKVQKEHTR